MKTPETQETAAVAEVVTSADALALVAAVAVPMAQNPAAVYLASLTAAASRSTMRAALNKIAGMLTAGAEGDALAIEWGALRFQHTATLRARLAEGYAASTANKHLAALRGVLKAAWRLKQIGFEDYTAAIDVRDIKSETLPPGRALAQGELYSLFAACAADTGPLGRRDAAVIALLFAAGLRRSELVSLQVADFEPESGLLTIRAGKGNKDRTAYATNGSFKALTAWLEVRGAEPGPLFCPLRRGGRIEAKPLSDESVRFALANRAKQAGVKAFSPHDLRRTFISELLDRGADIVTVQKLAGHANVSTTARYDRRGEDVKRAAVQLLHVPI